MPDEAVAAPAITPGVVTAPPPAPAAPAANTEGSVTSRLADFFTNADSAQVDNSTTDDEAPEPAKTDDQPPVEPSKDEKPDETKPDADTADKADKDAKADEPPAEQGEEDADFKALSKETTPREYLTDAEAAKAKYPRNSSNELIAELVEVSQEAKAGSELKAALGGEHFIEPLTKISKSLQGGEMEGLFTGIVEAASSEALLNVLGQAVYMSFVQGPTWESNPETAAFGKALTGIVDAAITQRFGPNATAEKLEKLAQWDSIGWFDKLEKWQTDNYVPQDELEQMLEMSNDPKYAALVKEKAELQAKLEEKATQDKSVATIEDTKVESSFGATNEGEIGRILTDVVWKNSVLRDVSTDTAEMKADKAFFRSRLQADAIEKFNQGEAKGKLLEAYKQGRQNTATYKKDLADAISDAVLATQEPTQIAQRMLAKVYGKQRTTKQPSTNGNTPSTEKLTPTTPIEPPATGTVKSKAETVKTFDDYFRSNAAAG